MSADIGGRSSGLVSGIMNMGVQAGGALTALLTPWLAMQYGWEMSFAVAAAIAIAGALLWLLVKEVATLRPPVQEYVQSMQYSGPGKLSHEADRV